MSLLRIAWRYFSFSGVPRLIHLLLGVSLVGIVISTAALVLVLSVFNGFTRMVEQLYNHMEPHVVVRPQAGKWLRVDSLPLERLRALPGVVAVSPVLDEKALVRLGNEKVVARVRGVQPDYVKHLGLDSAMQWGGVVLWADSVPFALIGAKLARRLGAAPGPMAPPLQLIFPRQPRRGLLNPAAAFRRARVAVGGVFSLSQESSNPRVWVPYPWLAEVLGRSHQATALAIRARTHDRDTVRTLAEQVRAAVGPDDEVLDFYQQHASLYRIFNIEKLAVFFILTLIASLAGFNISSAVLMFALERRRHFAILQVMGASRRFVRKMVMGASTVVTLWGGLQGLLLGYGVGRLQQIYGWVKLDAGASFVTQAYPVDFELLDFAAILTVILLIGLLAAILPARAAATPVTLNKLRLR